MVGPGASEDIGGGGDNAEQAEIVRLRQLLEDNGIEAPKGGPLSARAEDSLSAMVAERDAGV